MLKFTISDREPIWVNPDKILAVGPTTRGMDLGAGGGPGARIYVDIDRYLSVREPVADVVAKIKLRSDPRSISTAMMTGVTIKLNLVPVSGRHPRGQAQGGHQPNR